PPALPQPSVLFANAQLPDPHFWREAGPRLAASLTAQTGIAALLLQKPLLAALAFAMTVSFATVFSMSTRALQPRPPHSLPRSVLGVLLTIVLAIGLTVAGMTPIWM